MIAPKTIAIPNSKIIALLIGSADIAVIPSNIKSEPNAKEEYLGVQYEPGVGIN